MRFKNCVLRRKHKYNVMNEYWTNLVDTCYFLKKNKNSSIIKSFNGHKFHKIPDDVKQQVIKGYLREKELEYYQATK